MPLLYILVVCQHLFWHLRWYGVTAHQHDINYILRDFEEFRPVVKSLLSENMLSTLYSKLAYLRLVPLKVKYFAIFMYKQCISKVMTLLRTVPPVAFMQEN